MLIIHEKIAVWNRETWSCTHENDTKFAFYLEGNLIYVYIFFQDNHFLMSSNQEFGSIKKDHRRKYGVKESWKK